MPLSSNRSISIATSRPTIGRMEAKNQIISGGETLAVPIIPEEAQLKTNDNRKLSKYPTLNLKRIP